MTKLHAYHENHSKFIKSRVGSQGNSVLTRRDFLQAGMVLLSGAALSRFLVDLPTSGFAQELVGKRIYLAPDDHTDLFWAADIATYEKTFIEMLDYYLDLADQTQNESSEFQSRWNCDGSFWAWAYEKNKPQADFERLMERVRDGHISIPLNALCVCLGGAPMEAVLRGMYYPGKLERRYNLRFHLAYSMENQTLPLGLGALWTGSGATFSWKGICDCVTQVPNPQDREHDIYWWRGMDGSRILMKWNSFQGNQFIGGYAEARYPEDVVKFVTTNENFKAKYPYQIIGMFGYGWDDLQTQTNQFVSAAKKLSNQNFRVIVSNEIDFADDFEKTYGNDIPSLSVSFGNEWDLDCATMSEVSARVKRALEKLRAAEGLATLVTLKQNDFMQGRDETRNLAWMNLGLYWEHDWQGASWSDFTQRRIQWTKEIVGQIEDYVNTLYADALVALGNMIEKNNANERYFAFNPLSWERTDYVDYDYVGTEPVYVIDLENNQETPSQFVTKDGKRWLRILAKNVPAVGYKVFEIRNGAGQSLAQEVIIHERTIENQFYRVTVDARGAITSIQDKKNKDRELAAEVNGCFINDLGAGPGQLQIENDGPVSITLLATAGTPLAHTSRITLFTNIDRIEIQNDITQNFNQTNTWSFGFAFQNPTVYHEEVGAILSARLTNDGGHYSARNSRFDWLTLNHFVDINQGNEFGVTLSNADCYFMKLGNSTVNKLDTMTPQVSVLAGGSDMNSDGLLLNQGGDEHFLQRFALKSHLGYDPVSSMKFALEHQNPLVAGRVDGGDSYPENEYSVLSLDNPNVLLWAFKPAEDGIQAGLVARVWNMSNEKTEFAISLNEAGLSGALSLTHIETPVGISTVQDGKLVDLINQQQIKTYAIFPARLPYVPNTSGLNFATPTPAGAESTAVVYGSDASQSSTGVTDTPLPSSTATSMSGQQGKGCLFGLLHALGLKI